MPINACIENVIGRGQSATLLIRFRGDRFSIHMTDAIRLEDDGNVRFFSVIGTRHMLVRLKYRDGDKLRHPAAINFNDLPLLDESA